MFVKLLSDIINNSISKDFFYFARLKFYFQTLLLFLVCFSFFDNDSLNSLISSNFFRNSFLVCWITENEPTIFSVENIYLNFEFFILILFILSDRTGIYTIELTHFLKTLISFQIYFLLILQLFANLHITSVGIDYWIRLCSNGQLSIFPTICSFGINLFFIGMMILRYFYNPNDK